jgi:hypothetical protein
MINVDDADDQQQLRCRVIKIEKLCSKVIKGYSKHYEENNSCSLPEQCLNEIKLLFDHRIECRCAKYNLTKEEEEQWELSNTIVDSDERSNTDDKSEEHDLDKINTYMTSKGKDEDKDNGEKYLHLGKKVDMKGVEESLPLGVKIRMMREKGELLQKNGYSCVVVLLTSKTSAWK